MNRSSSSEALLWREAVEGDDTLAPFFQRKDLKGDLDRDRCTFAPLRGVVVLFGETDTRQNIKSVKKKRQKKKKKKNHKGRRTEDMNGLFC